MLHAVVEVTVHLRLPASYHHPIHPRSRVFIRLVAPAFKRRLTASHSLSVHLPVVFRQVTSPSPSSATRHIDHIHLPGYSRNCTQLNFTILILVVAVIPTYFYVPPVSTLSPRINKHVGSAILPTRPPSSGIWTAASSGRISPISSAVLWSASPTRVLPSARSNAISTAASSSAKRWRGRMLQRVHGGSLLLLRGRRML